MVYTFQTVLGQAHLGPGPFPATYFVATQMGPTVIFSFYSHSKSSFLSLLTVGVG